MEVYIYSSFISLLFSIAFSATLLVIALQDFKSYEVNLFLFPLGFVAITIAFTENNSMIIFIQTFLFNALFVALLIGGVWLWFTIRRKMFINITKGLIGWGDIFFLLMITPVFEFNYFVTFLTFSFGIALVYSTVIYLRKGLFKKIPLAGIMAFNLLFIFIYSFIHR